MMQLGQAMIWTALSLGVGSSLHCVGMCGPLVMSLPVNQVSRLEASMQFMLYTISKALMYGVIGLLPGWLGWNVQKWTGAGWVSFIVGCMILIFAFVPSRKVWRVFPSFSNWINLQFQKVYNQPKWYFFMLSGLLNAFLPCGMIIIALSASMVTASPLGSFLFMFYFGLGTMPALAAVHLSKAMYLQRFRTRAQNTSRIITLALGAVLIVRSLMPSHQHASTSSEKEITICKPTAL